MNITEWKNSGCEYYAGVALYAQQQRPHPMLLRRFQQKKTEALRQKLIYELGKFETETVKEPVKPKITIEVDVAPVKAVVTKVQKAYEAPTPVMMHDLPKEMRPTLEKANNLFKKACKLKIDLNELKPEQETEAFKIQCEIEDLLKANRVAWSKIDYYLEFKSMPPAPKSIFEGMTGAQLAKREQSKHEAISKAKKRISVIREALQNPESVQERTKLERRLERTRNTLLKHQQELVTLKALING